MAYKIDRRLPKAPNYLNAEEKRAYQLGYVIAKREESQKQSNKLLSGK